MIWKIYKPCIIKRKCFSVISFRKKYFNLFKKTHNLMKRINAGLLKIQIY